MSKLGFETMCVQTGAGPDPTYGSRQVPIHQSVSFVFKDAQHGANLFALKEFGNVYGRLTNPTQAALEERLAALEGGTGATLAASGHAAQLLAFMALLTPGDEIVASKRVYGGTFNQLSQTFPTHFGWNAHFVDADNLDEVKRAVNERTRVIYAESIANPSGAVVDIEGLAKIAADAGVPLVIDNTIPTSYLCRPIEWGADLVTYSTTKFLCGNGSALGGAVIEAGKFDWKKSGKYPALSEPNASYQGLNFSETFGNIAFTVFAHAIGLRDLGPSQAPMNAFLTLLGVETLPLRMDRHVENAKAVAEHLRKHPKVSWVTYSGLPDSPYYKLVQKYSPKGAGAVFTVGVKGGYEEGKNFMESLALFSMLANIGDTRSLCIHPASTTHHQLDEATRQKLGIKPEAVRLSVGIETLSDLLADLDQALANMDKRRA